MASPSSDRNLLFGILALQMDFITREQLVAAMQGWLLNKAQTLGDILENHGALSPARHQMLEPLVQEHIKQHGNDPQQSLAAVSSVDAIKQELEQLADADLSQSLGTIGYTPSPTDDQASPLSPASGERGRGEGAATRFRILRPHAKGGLGQVSVALDLELQREVALKEIQEHYADYDDSRQRFLKEGEITGKLEHPGIVPVYGLGQYADGRPFYAMRFIQGDSLKDAIERYHRPDRQGQADSERTLELRKLLGRFLDVCNAIAYAHSRGVLHRDLKPGNIMLGQYGETLVVDWGLAKVLGQKEPEATLPAHPVAVSSGSAATAMGKALGTPAYMSPEQAAGRLDQLGPASDVYSLGATLYCLLTGHAPIENVTAVDAVLRVQKGDFPRPRQVNPTVPPPLEAVCLKAMALKPEDRYVTVRALAEDMERWLADDPVSAWPEPWKAKARRWAGRHRPLVTGAATAVLVAVVGLGAATLLLQAANEDLIVANKAEGTAKELAERQKTEAEKQKAAADQQKSEAETQKGLADRQKTLAEQRAKDLLEALAKVEKAEAITKQQLAQLAILSGHAADDAWEIGKVERAHELLLGVPVDLRQWEWNYRQRRFQGSYATLFGHTDVVRSVVFSPDGRLLASGSYDQTVKVWDAATGQELLSLRGHTNLVLAVAFSPDGRRLASGSLDQKVKLWDAATGQELRTLSGHTDWVESVAFSPDGRRLASGSRDKTVKVWDAATGQELLSLPGHTNIVTSVAFSPDSQRLASGSYDKTVKLWDVATGKELLSLRGHTDLVWSVAFSPDGQRLASGSFQVVKVWDAATGQELLSPRGHTSAVYGVAFSPDGRRFASASYDKTVKLWDARTGLELLSLRGHTDRVYCVTFSPDGRGLASGSQDKTVKLWDATTGQELLSLRGHTNLVRSVAFSPDGRRLASGSVDQTVKVWNAATGQELLSLPGHAYVVDSVAFSSDGQRLASASWDKTVKVWDAATGQELLSLPGHTNTVSSVAFSPDGRQLASGSIDKTVKLWNVATGQELLSLRGHTAAVTSVAFSPDGRRLASGSQERTVKLWDAATGQELLSLPGHKSGVSSLAFSPDSRRLASGSQDKTVKLWDAATGQELLNLRGHTDEVFSVAFSPDGRRLASGSRDKTVKVWDAVMGQELLSLRGHTDEVFSVAFSPDGRRLASGSTDRTVKLWDARSALLDASPPDVWELGYRQWAGRFSPVWHKGQAQKGEKDKDLYATAFHRSQLAAHLPNDAATWKSLEAACKQLGDWQLAATACERVLSHGPALAPIYERQADYQDRQKALSK